MEATNTQNGGIVTDAINALNAATKSGDDLQKQYVTAAIDALNILLTSDVSPRLASKIARFRKVLKDYAENEATKKDATQTAINFDDLGGAKDANGNDVNDVYTV